LTTVPDDDPELYELDDELEDEDDEDEDLDDDELRYQDDESRELLERYDEPEPELDPEPDDRYLSPPPARPKASLTYREVPPISIRKNIAAAVARTDGMLCFMDYSSCLG